MTAIVDVVDKVVVVGRGVVIGILTGVVGGVTNIGFRFRFCGGDADPEVPVVVEVPVLPVREACVASVPVVVVEEDADNVDVEVVFGFAQRSPALASMNHGGIGLFVVVLCSGEQA